MRVLRRLSGKFREDSDVTLADKSTGISLKEGTGSQRKNFVRDSVSSISHL